MIMNETATYLNDRFVDEGDDPFQPTWMIVGQWDSVHPYPHGSDNHLGISEEYLNRVCTVE